MASKSDFPAGTRVRGRVPNGGATYDATVTGVDGRYIITKDATGKDRKALPGLLTRL